MMRAPLVSAALVLASCAAGPDYRPAPLPAAAGGAFAGAAPDIASSDAAPPAWRHLYNDPVLDDLVSEAFAANTDLRIATANLRRASAALTEAKGARLPTTTVTASAVEARQTVPTANGPVPFSSEFYRAGLDVSHEIDVYGRVSRSIEASRADAEAATRDAVPISVAAETTRAHADACSAARQLAVATQSLNLQTDSFDLTRKRVAAGRDSPLDAARARAQLAAARAAQPGFAADQRSALFRLAVLTGKPPTAVDPRAPACMAPPLLRTALPTGDGAALLKRRPDVRRADRQLAAATARIGVATAELCPRIGLGGAITGQGVTPGAVICNNGFGFNIGPVISWSFPNMIADRARIKQARAGGEAALAGFDGTVLKALKEV